MRQSEDIDLAKVVGLLSAMLCALAHPDRVREAVLRFFSSDETWALIRPSLMEAYEQNGPAAKQPDGPPPDIGPGGRFKP